VRDANIEYRELLKDILLHGVPVSPRSQLCKELLCRKTVIDMDTCFISIPERKLGKRFRAAEAAWILSGDNRVNTIENFSKKIGDYSDDGVYFSGAYGPPFRDQLPYVLRCLKSDIESRQGVITIWRSRPFDSKDIPCTVSLQFIIRDFTLHTIATMRSSDAWLGWPYDIHNFSCMSAYLLLSLVRASRTYEDIKLGQLHLTAGSQHLYHENWKKALRVFDSFSGLTEIQRMNLKSKEESLDWKGYTPDEFIESLWKKANTSSH